MRERFERVNGGRLAGPTFHLDSVQSKIRREGDQVNFAKADVIVMAEQQMTARFEEYGGRFLARSAKYAIKSAFQRLRSPIPDPRRRWKPPARARCIDPFLSSDRRARWN